MLSAESCEGFLSCLYLVSYILYLPLFFSPLLLFFPSYREFIALVERQVKSAGLGVERGLFELGGQEGDKFGLRFGCIKVAVRHFARLMIRELVFALIFQQNGVDFDFGSALGQARSRRVHNAVKQHVSGE